MHDLEGIHETLLELFENKACLAHVEGFCARKSALKTVKCHGDVSNFTVHYYGASIIMNYVIKTVMAATFPGHPKTPALNAWRHLYLLASVCL